MALRGGDPGPFEAFVHSETETFLGFFLRLGASRVEAEDLVQELFMKLFRNAAAYTPSERFAAFAFRVARNAWIDRQRGRARAEHALHCSALARDSSEGSLQVQAARALERLAAQEELERLWAALRELPEHHRMVFELGLVQELPYAEIAALLEIPVGTVKSRMHHAVRRLRSALDHAGAVPEGGSALGLEERRA